MMSDTPENGMTLELQAVSQSGEEPEDQVVSDSVINAARDFKIDEVKKHLEEGTIFKQYLSVHQVQELYKTNTEDIGDDGETKKSVDADSDTSIEAIRTKFNGYFKKMAGCPLSCKGKESCCTPSGHTCLPAVQELFLWSLQATHERSMELAILLWNYCEDKISCACIGWAVKTAMMKKEKSESDQKWYLEECAIYFEGLAESTLDLCYKKKRVLTRFLLRKQCPWWNNLSILQIVVGTENMKFLAESACEEHMTYLWMGGTTKEPRRKPGFQTLVDAEPKDFSYLDKLPTCKPFSYLSWPVVRYSISLILHLVFLGLYSFVLLFSFRRSLTKSFYALIVWVADIGASELRQALNPNPRNNANCLEVNEHCKTYWKQKWNWLDVLTIALFAVGMLVFAQNEVLHIIGKTVLSIDLFFFCIRMLQLLMVFKELGLLLVMVKKMIKDTINFMFILLVFVFAFAVSSEAILYSKRNLNYIHIFLLLRKAYWQVFGELFLDEISLPAKGYNDTASSICTDPPCPSTYGQYFVPIMLGFYVMVTNVLLLNLLIARFNMTFQEVHGQAMEYQSWHRAMIIIEYHDRPHLPPPLNILRLVYGCIQSCYLCCILCKEESTAEMETESQNENYKEKVKEMKKFEETHSRAVLEKYYPSLLKQSANSDSILNSLAQTNRTSTEMGNHLKILSQQIKQLLKSNQEEEDGIESNN